MLQLTALLLVAQVQVPPPRGYVNDFAGVLDSASVTHMEAVIAEVRAKTRGEIAVVTLPDIDDRPAADVALEIGRQWGVGVKGEAGDPAKNLASWCCSFQRRITVRARVRSSSRPVAAPRDSSRTRA